MIRCIAFFSILLLVGGISCSKDSASTSLSRSFCLIPLKFVSYTEAPLIDVDIDGVQYQLKIDTGSTTCFTLKKRVLDQIDSKEPIGTCKAYDFRGNSYEEPEYLIPKVTIGKLYIEPGIASEENYFFLTQGSKSGPPLKTLDRQTKKQLAHVDGRIGNGVFKSIVCFFDFSREHLLIAEDINEFKKEGILNGYTEVPFELHKGLVILSAMTDLGPVKLLLDSGASVSILKGVSDEPIFVTHKIKHLTFGACEYGSWDFRLIPFTDKISDLDGILGADFFNKHAICLDFHNQVAYIQPPKSFLETFSAWLGF